MLKKPLKKSSAVFFINLHVSTKVRYMAASLAPASLLNPPKFFLRFVNGRTAPTPRVLYKAHRILGTHYHALCIISFFFCHSIIRNTVNDTIDHVWLAETLLVPFFKYMIRDTICLEVLGDRNALAYSLTLITTPKGLDVFTTYCHNRCL